MAAGGKGQRPVYQQEGQVEGHLYSEQVIHNSQKSEGGDTHLFLGWDTL